MDKHNAIARQVSFADIISTTATSENATKVTFPDHYSVKVEDAAKALDAIAKVLSKYDAHKV